MEWRHKMINSVPKPQKKAKKKKSDLQKKKDNPNSKYWKSRALKLWGKVIHLKFQETCIVNDNCSGKTEAHHLISRSVRGFNTDLRNGVLLCSKHHKLDTMLSAHKAPLSFAIFLQENYPHIWKWFDENKYKIIQKKHCMSYKESYEQLLIVKKELE